MADSRRTFRLSSVPKDVNINGLRAAIPKADQETLIKAIVAPDLHSPSEFNVWSLCFQKLIKFNPKLTDGKGSLKITQGSREYQVNIDDDFHGLTPLFQPQDDIQVDIIAMTGLAGRALGSWQTKDSQLWLHDYLPQEVPNARIMIYGYPSKVYKSNVNAQIEDYTIALNNAIERLRVDHERRPLLLIGHSLGCIIIKQAVVNSFQLWSHKPKFYNSTCGIVFFGAPHNGLYHRTLEQLLEKKPPESLMQQLKPQSPTLMALNSAFAECSTGIPIVTCYERLATATLQEKKDGSWAQDGPPALMVPEDSASLNLTNEVKIPVWGNHSTIAKLNNDPGSDYHEIARQIKIIAVSARQTIEGRFDKLDSTQDVLDLMLILQYELARFLTWFRLYFGDRLVPASSTDLIPLLNAKISATAPIDTKSLLDAVNSVVQIYMQLADLLEAFSQGGQQERSFQTRSPSDEVSRGQLEFLPSVLLQVNQYLSHDGAKKVSQGDSALTRFHISKWTTQERQKFSSLVADLRLQNTFLIGVDSRKDTIDLGAYARVLSSTASQSDETNVIERATISYPFYQALSYRATYKRQVGASKIDDEDWDPEIDPTDIEFGRSSSKRRLISTLSRETDSSKMPTPSRVLVEWYPYHADKLEELDSIDLQISNTARLLHSHKKPAFLSTLHCQGFTRQETRVGFCFDLPVPPVALVETLTLHAYLQGARIFNQDLKRPSLHERFRIAERAALSMMELHSAGWLHKSFHGGNIILFAFKSGSSTTVTKLFVSGFDISREDKPDEISRKTKNKDYAIYYHPDLRHGQDSEHPPSFQRLHDIYSLGLLLLEIGISKKIDWGESQDKDSIDDFVIKAKDCARDELPLHMGDRYAKVVLDCLDYGDIEDTFAEPLYDVGNDMQQRRRQGLQIFFWQIVQQLQGCHCQYPNPDTNY